jgi:hypothetical protein
MVGQRELRPHDVLERQVFAIFLRDQRALLMVVVGGHDGVEVERELVGLALGGRRRLGGELLDGRRRRRVGRDRRVGGLGRVRCDFLEQGVLEELLLDDLLELERRELQELDGLLQQRRHDDPLALP